VDPLAGFDVSLLDLPENASVEATRARLRSIQMEQIRLKTEYDARVSKAADAAQNRDEVFFYLYPTGPRPQKPLDPNALAGKIYAFRVAALRRLADAAELPLEVRGEYYRQYVELAPFASAETCASLEQVQAFFSALIAEEEAKPSPDLGRVLELRRRFASAWVFVKVAPNASASTPERPPFDRAAAEKLLDIPKGESSKFYDDYLLQLYKASTSAPADPSFDDLRARLLEANAERSRLYNEALKREADAFDRDALAPLLDVPQGETAAFYLERFQKLSDVRDEIARNPKLFSQTQKINRELDYVAKRLAYADDLSPLQRFEYFQRWTQNLDLNGLLDAIDAETARDATSEIDRQRRPYLELALLKKQTSLLALEDADVQTKRQLGLGADALQGETNILGISPAKPEKTTRFLAIADQYVARALDGALPWKLGGSWAKEAAQFALAVERLSQDPELAAYIGKRIAARLAESENESDRKVGLSLSRNVLSKELRTRFDGRFIPVEGQNLDGTPFDWNAYRGAPTLIEIVLVSPLGTPIVRNPFAPTQAKARPGFVTVAQSRLDRLAAPLDEYEKAGLRRVRYVAAPPETARLFVEQVQGAARSDDVKTNVLKSYNDATSIFSATPDAEFVTPTSWRNHWTDALYQRPQAILVDADGKTLATFDNFDKFDKALRQLFPNVSAKAK
ncbi:MAG: hypothetical protein IKW13_07600, partial [Thermoguttaceae bacterium]|nr:hypothetical protein [Thermoguttaceae bacterium]